MRPSGPYGEAGIEDTDVEAVGEVVRALYASAGQARLYGPSHPQTLRAVEDCQRRVEEITGWLGPLVLSTSRAGIDWRGTRVMDERDDSEGIGRHLHIEGISELTFAPGLTVPELSQFLQVARLNLSLPEYEEETLESLLWQAELEHVGFRAISELMDAESLSGQMDPELLDDAERVKSLLDLQAGDLEVGRHLLKKLEDHRMPGLGDVVDHWGLDEEIDLSALDDDEFKVRFLDGAGEDLPELMQLRNEIANERSSQLLARTVSVLMRASLATRPELPPAEAFELATGAMRQLYVVGDPVGILQVLEDGHRLAQELSEPRPDAARGVRGFLKRTFSPIRVARMLRFMNPGEPLERRTLERFVRLLPDTAIVTLFDGIRRDEQPARYRPMLTVVLGLVGDRVESWLGDAERIPMEQLLPIIFAMELVGGDRLRRARPALLRHPSPPVREAALGTYARELPDADVQRVATCLVDRSSIVRAQATAILARHRPPRAVAMLEQSLGGTDFSTLDRSLKADLCIAYGRVAGPSAIPLLSDLLNTRAGLLGDENVETTLEGAALGLAAVGTANALRTLEKGARALSGARRRACSDALDALAAEARRG